MASDAAGGDVDPCCWPPPPICAEATLRGTSALASDRQTAAAIRLMGLTASVCTLLLVKVALDVGCVALSHMSGYELRFMSDMA